MAFFLMIRTSVEEETLLQDQDDDRRLRTPRFPWLHKILMDRTLKKYVTGTFEVRKNMVQVIAGHLFIFP